MHFHLVLLNKIVALCKFKVRKWKGYYNRNQIMYKYLWATNDFLKWILINKLIAVSVLADHYESLLCAWKYEFRDARR